MNKELVFPHGDNGIRTLYPNASPKPSPQHLTKDLPEVLFVTTYPPIECGIATYSQDLLRALDKQFSNTFSLKVCALECGKGHHVYPEEVKYTLDTSATSNYKELAHRINVDKKISLLLVQHEFGLFSHTKDDAFLQFLYSLMKPAIVVFHTVLPRPNEDLKAKVKLIANTCQAIIVMTKNAAHILMSDYEVAADKVVVIAHGTHLVPHLNKDVLKEKYNLAGRKVLSTFGLLGSGKGIETTLDALPAIVKANPKAIFLIIGKTHPGVIKSEGEKYREMLEAKVEALKLQKHVRYINQYLPLEDLLEYLQLTDIYLFTSKDPNQAVSGTFSYAMSCGCPIISTPIPHAREVLSDDTGILVDFQNSEQLFESVNRLMSDEGLRIAYGSNVLQRIVPTAWENAAIAHALLFKDVANKTNSTGVLLDNNDTLPQARNDFNLQYRLPAVSMSHVKKMTTDFGMIQFAQINQPDITSGYTLDDNARALIATCMHYELTGDDADLILIKIYLDFIKYCQQPHGIFLNYVDDNYEFTDQNYETNLSDANGRAIWALGYFVSRQSLFSPNLITMADNILQTALPSLDCLHSTRSMAFTIKGLCYYNEVRRTPLSSALVKIFANRILQMYRHESEHNWHWFESYLTYANSILPEAMLCAYQDTLNHDYKEVAKLSFDFLLGLTFNDTGIKVISNKSWLYKGEVLAQYGEQPIDIAYTILALSRFYQVFKDPNYAHKITTAFNWFLGNNHLHQIIYNPCTGGCYDGLEETHVNLNQGAESTLSYLMARLTIETHNRTPRPQRYRFGETPKDAHVGTRNLFGIYPLD